MLSRSVTLGKSRKLDVLTPRRTVPVASSWAELRSVASGTPAPTTLPNSRRDSRVMSGSSQMSTRFGRPVRRSFPIIIPPSWTRERPSLSLLAWLPVWRCSGREPPRARAVRHVPPARSRPCRPGCPPTCAFRTGSPTSRWTTSTITPGGHSLHLSGRRLQAIVETHSRRRGLSASGPRVFDTYKALWEIYHSDGSAPEAAYDRYDAAAHNPCGVAQEFGDLTVGSASGIDDLGQAGIGMLDPPVVAQNGRYVRTLTFFNRVAFDHIVTNRFYLRERAASDSKPAPGTSSHRVSNRIDCGQDRVDRRQRAAVRPGETALHANRLVKRATGGGCAKATMGLIGLHIAQKTPSRPQWIWSSFEQKEVVPPKWADWPGAYFMHDGTGTPMPERNPLSLSPVAPEPVRPFNVVRSSDAPILTSTELTSHAYQRLLAGTPWQVLPPGCDAVATTRRKPGHAECRQLATELFRTRFPAPVRSPRLRTSRWRPSISAACSSGA